MKLKYRAALLLGQNDYSGDLTASNGGTIMLNQYKKNTFLSASSFGLTMLICLGIPVNSTYASDTDIYTSAQKGNTTLMFMLDTSSSMYGDTRAGNSFGREACEFRSNDSNVILNNIINPTAERPYTRRYCTPTRTDNTQKLDRITRLKDAMYDLLNGSATVTRIADDVIVGLADYSAPNNNSNSGRIIVPARALGQVLTRADDNTATYTQNLYRRRSTANSYNTCAVYGDDGYACATWNTDNITIATLPAGVTCNGTSSGSICSKTIPLTFITQRDLLIDKIKSGIGKAAVTYTPTANIYADVAAYLMGMATSSPGSSLTYSSSKTKNAADTSYVGPVSISSQLNKTDEQKICNGQGIYVLTDGEPNIASGNANSIALPLMREALNNTQFSCTNPKLISGGISAGWECIGEFSKKLFDKTQNPARVSFKTAVVGFGGVFSGFDTQDKVIGTDGKIRTFYNCNDTTDTTLNARNACNWGEKTPRDPNSTTTPKTPYTGWANVGGLGEGGFYSASEPDDVIDSVQKFIDDITPKPISVTTGIATIPTDALYPSKLQPFAYFAQFDPQPAAKDKLWLGNMKKYDVFKGVIGIKSGSTSFTEVIDVDGKPTRITDLWAKSSLSGTTASISSLGGFKSKIPVGNLASAATATSSAMPQVASTRQLYTNRTTSDAGVASENNTNDSRLTSVTATDYINSTDPLKVYLYNLLGYDLPTTTASITNTLLETTPRFTKVGGTMHSRPILLTQGGKVVVDANGVLTTENRNDYILFGSTQGVLHVVEASGTNAGNEKFAFVPHEMIENSNQRSHFLNAMPQDATINSNLDYGVDGPWTAYTEYVPTSNGGLTVDAGRSPTGGTALKGKQWVYGGLRMGGRGYYALDLGNMDAPKLKFHINPSGACTNDNPIGCMGQSWSKPSIAWVNWNGTRKLVMFVGGGYDNGYENPAYNPNPSAEPPTKAKGNGIYMFDAKNGTLLWWASSDATLKSKAAGDTDNTASRQATNNTNLNYSVVSKIKTIDRNNDGLVDNLYFGDLGGQVFRVDINNSNTATAFATRVVRILNLHSSTGGTSPRFYEAPAFTIHKNTDGVTFGVVSIGSGNRSKPLFPLNSAGNGFDADTGYENDGVYAIYDKDVAKSDLYTTTTLDTQNISIGTATDGTTLGLTTRQAEIPYARGGWYYLFSSSTSRTVNSVTLNYAPHKQVVKVLEEPVAIANDLYVSVFDSSKPGIEGQCGSGVKGETFVNRFCLPYGSCGTARNPTNNDTFSLGVGILGISMGGGATGEEDSRGITFLNSTKKSAAETATSLFNYRTPTKLIPQRWYEKYAQ